MAVKTQLTPEDFVGVLLPYNLGALRRAEPIERGTVQTTYVLRTTRGRFALRCYENRSRASVLFERDLLTYLAERRYPCPAPVLTTDGSYVGTHQGKPYLFFDFAEGQSVEHPSLGQTRQLIQMAA